MSGVFRSIGQAAGEFTQATVGPLIGGITGGLGGGQQQQAPQQQTALQAPQPPSPPQVETRVNQAQTRTRREQPRGRAGTILTRRRAPSQTGIGEAETPFPFRT